jgi:hypothetical protein
LNQEAAVEALSDIDMSTFEAALNACGPDTAHPAIKDIHASLVKNLGTFGSCVVATALFIAAMRQKGEKWVARLVKDPEFLEGHVLRNHWVAMKDGIALDVTVGDSEKKLRTRGREAEMKEVNGQLKDGKLLERMDAGLRNFRDENGPLLKGVTAADLIRTVYQEVILSNPVKAQTVRVVPMATLG